VQQGDRALLEAHHALRSAGARNGESRLSKGPVISIVEDDANVRTATESLVKSHGFDVCAFASAQEFLQSRGVAETACLISNVQSLL
jgi:hypothetical protein